MNAPVRLNQFKHFACVCSGNRKKGEKDFFAQAFFLHILEAAGKLVVKARKIMSETYLVIGAKRKRLCWFKASLSSRR